jgi:glutamine cyclotransferase
LATGATTSPYRKGDQLRTWRVDVLRSYPHPGRGFTQGLIVGNGSAREPAIWESTGLYGQSALTRYRLGNVVPQRRAKLPGWFFGEGICRVGAGAHIWQLTWQEGVALRWDARILEPLEEVPYDREGWGICAVGAHLVTSDGGSELVRRHPGTLAERDVLRVRYEGAPVYGLNDLTWDGNRIWANVIGTATLLGIDPDTGVVTDIVDARRARERHPGEPEAVMNGLAALSAPGEFLLTGKTWRVIRHVRLVPARVRPRRLSAVRSGLLV